MTVNAGFVEIRNYLAGRAIGITRDKSLLHEVVKCLFCNIHFMKKKSKSIAAEILANDYRKAFLEIKKKLPDVFNRDEEIMLDPGSLQFIDRIFEQIAIRHSHDPLNILYQTFVNTDTQANEGQFFTPFEAVKFLVDALNPSPNEKIIDPACGAGGFLSFTAHTLMKKGLTGKQVSNNVFGIEKDSYLAKLANTHIALTTFHKSNIICGDSIEWKTQNNGNIGFPLENSFDIVLANPPFGAKIKVGSENSRKKFDLAYRWARSKKDNSKFERTNVLAQNPTPQMLFLELCIKLLKEGGRLGVVLPESLITSWGSSYVSQFLLEKATIEGLIGMPENLFKTSGKGGTHTKTCLLIAMKKKAPKNHKIFMADAKWCGHDSRGNSIPFNDLPNILLINPLSILLECLVLSKIPR